jgi:hypothetical protein
MTPWLDNDNCNGKMAEPASTEAVFAFQVSVKGKRWTTIVNARTPGQAKRIYYFEVRESWPELPYTALRCRKIGPPHSSEQFLRNASYRGMPDVRCGQRVLVGGERGVIVGHNASANFDVLFDASSKHRGQTLNVHPDSIVIDGQNDQAHA